MNIDSFLESAINDTQATIRGLDVKIGFVFVLLAAPVSKLSEIIDFLIFQFQFSGLLFLSGCLVVLSLWMISVSTLFYSLCATSKVKLDFNRGSVTGVYYNVDKKALKIKEATIGSFSSKIESINITHELVFELMKLQSIRNKKTKALNFSLISTFLTIIFAFMMCVAYVVRSSYA